MSATYSRQAGRTPGTIIGQVIDRILAGACAAERGERLLKEVARVMKLQYGMLERVLAAVTDLIRTEAQQSSLEGELGRQREELARVHAQLEGCTAAIRECGRITEDLYTNDVLYPLVRYLMRMRSDVMRGLACASDAGGKGILEAIQAQVEEMVFGMGFDLMLVKEGDVFVPEMMRAVGEIETGNAREHRTVARVVEQGLTRKGWKEYARVFVYKHVNGSSL